MNAVRDNTTPSRKDRSGWVIAIVVGALASLSSAGLIGIIMSNMNTRCSRLSADPSAGGSADPLRLNDALSFYCSSVSPGSNLALWAVIFGLVIGAFTAGVIGIRARP